jgi:hypothetical protein
MEPKDRVNAFIADYFGAHGRIARKSEDEDRFDAWDAEVRELETKHFSGNGGRELAGVIHGESPHVPGKQPIVGIAPRSDRVFVETRLETSDPLLKWCEYELKDVDGDWRIVCIREYLDAPDDPFVKAADRSRFTSLPPAPAFSALDTEDEGLDGNVPFEVGRIVVGKDEKSPIEVRPVGMLNCPTGVLAACDFGYGSYSIYPLRHSIPPGRYPVEVGMAFGRNCAVRVKVSDRAVKSWHPAYTTHDRFVVGVDAGNVGIFDVTAILDIKARDKERAFESYALKPDNTTSMMLSLSSPDDVAIVDSGWGDGGYPMFWGVDADGRPAILLVEFLIITGSRKIAPPRRGKKKIGASWWKSWKK